MKKVMIVSAVLMALVAAPALAVAGPLQALQAATAAGPTVGIDYTNVGLHGQAGRPGISLTAGNLYANNVIADGSLTVARGYYQMTTSIGKAIPADGVIFEPYLSTGLLSLNSTNTQSIQDFYGLAGVNLTVPFSSKISFGLGGGFGHTVTTFGGSGGSVYTGDAMAAFQIAPRVTTDLQVSYQHVPGASITGYLAGINYSF